MSAEIRYVENVSPGGWLNVRLTASNIVAPLPYMLKVSFEKRTGGRDYFKILEGLHIDKEASVSEKDAHSSYLVTGSGHSRPAICEFDKTKKTFKITGLGTFTAFTDPSNPVPNGVHEIEIPAAPHDLGSGYLAFSEYAKTWFRVGNVGDRFLHPGRVSLGCITVDETISWTQIYTFLIKSRNNSRSVGTVNVK
ncbi:MAG: hypothetical protein HRT58_10725 [Crocinitomicaceae bacterium]|nr:hypothetical protein [Flavobacteriales bacterium]NQZ36128.1 hypothetical protein [Crocinitomicaceae bacterium]